MSYLALYRKYRSSNFDEVYGQDSIIRTLKNALNSNKIAHAYLFSGPRGTGKTSVARLFAKALNCEEGLGHECNQCINCKEITKGSSPDVIEIDAASNSGVNEVRNLIENVKYAPIKGRYKVYIIDEVHMMSNSAFNALLKTLEEPPSYVVFILCTTELYKVLPTIVSRCQRYEFKKLDDDALRKLLINVLNKENIQFTSGVIDLLIELANGGGRDALSILDQVISYSGNFIKVEDIEQLFGIANKKDKIAILEFIKNKDTLGLIKKFDFLVNENIDLVRFINELLLLLKDSLIYKCSNENENMYVKIVSEYFSKEELLTLISLIIELQKEFKCTSNPSLITEIYLLKMIQSLSNSNSLIEITKKESLNNKEENKSIKEEKNNEELNINKNKNDDLLSNFYYKEEEKPIIQDTHILNKEKIIEKPKPVQETPITSEPLTSSLLPSNNNSYSLTLDELINISVLNNTLAKKKLISRWDSLASFISTERDSQIAMLLLSGTPYLFTDTILVLRFDDSKNAKILNNKEYQDEFSNFVEKIVGSKVELYGIDRIVSAELLQKYRNLSEINMLPKAKDIEKVSIKKEE